MQLSFYKDCLIDEKSIFSLWQLVDIRMKIWLLISLTAILSSLNYKFIFILNFYVYNTYVCVVNKD